MNEIEKILRKLTAKEQEAMLLLMQQIKDDYRKVPGVQALQGMKGFFRVRLGSYRIIFVVDPKTQTAKIRRVTRRNEQTYKRLK